MRQAVMAGLMVLAVLASGALAADEAAVELKSNDQRMSYSLGLQVGESLKNFGMPLDLKAFFDGVTDKFESKKVKLTDEEIETLRQEFVAHMRAKQEEQQKVLNQKRSEEGEKNLKEEAEFLAKNAKAEGVVTTESGLQYQVVKQGDGEKPKATDVVKVHYRGTLLNGEEFDSSYKRGEPVTFPVGRVIPGWTEALQLMSVGSKYKLFIPSKLGYGQRGAPSIGPNSTLVFDVELLGIETK